MQPVSKAITSRRISRSIGTYSIGRTPFRCGRIRSKPWINPTWSGPPFALTRPSLQLEEAYWKLAKRVAGASDVVIVGEGDEVSGIGPPRHRFANSILRPDQKWSVDLVAWKCTDGNSTKHIKRRWLNLIRTRPYRADPCGDLEARGRHAGDDDDRPRVPAQVRAHRPLCCPCLGPSPGRDPKV